MTVRLLLALFILPFIFISCSKDDNPVTPPQITGSGDLITVERTLVEFHSVNLITVGNVNLTRGVEQAVSITVDDNVVDHIVTTVTNGELVIGSDPEVNLSDFDLTVNLTMTDLESVTLSGVGNIIGVNTFQVDTLGINFLGVGNMDLTFLANYLSTTHTGVGNITLWGTVIKHESVHTSVSNLSAYSLISDTTIANLSGVGNLHVYANDYLEVNISGIGSLYYKGQPSINVNITGQGSVIDAN